MRPRKSHSRGGELKRWAESSKPLCHKDVDLVSGISLTQARAPRRGQAHNALETDALNPVRGARARLRSLSALDAGSDGLPRSDGGPAAAELADALTAGALETCDAIAADRSPRTADRSDRVPLAVGVRGNRGGDQQPRPAVRWEGLLLSRHSHVDHRLVGRAGCAGQGRRAVEPLPAARPVMALSLRMLCFCENPMPGSRVPFATLPMRAVDLYTRQIDGFNNSRFDPCMTWNASSRVGATSRMPRIAWARMSTETTLMGGRGSPANCHLLACSRSVRSAWRLNSPICELQFGPAGRLGT